MATEVIKFVDKQLDASSLYMQSVFDKIYPVGSIYMSVNSTSPATLFGGTWEQMKDRFLVGAGNDYAVNSTGGSTTHSHTYGIKFGGYYKDFIFAENGNVGLLNYNSSNDISISGYYYDGSADLDVNSSSSTGCATFTPSTYRMYANASYTNSTPPLLGCVYVETYRIRRDGGICNG